MDWFETLTGFREGSYGDTRSQLDVRAKRLHSTANGRSWSTGELETPSVAALRERAKAQPGLRGGKLKVSCVSGDVRAMHRDPANTGALFQVASQFNLLEMIGPDVTPEHGVTRYATDRTQGPACAIAAGAATIFRNYFADVDGASGQTRNRQIDCLRDLGAALGNEAGALWTMRNGYALCSAAELAAIEKRLGDATESERDRLRDLLRIGVHRDVEATETTSPHPLVSQAFCSALPVSYTSIAARQWKNFATLVLEGAYEATLWAAVLNRRHASSSSNVVFLTMLGGGAFGNDPSWILGALARSFDLMKDIDLDVRIVSYGSTPSELIRLAQRY